MTSGRSSSGSAANQRPAASAWRWPSSDERHVDVAQVEVDDAEARFMRRVARDIALALPVPDEPQALGPMLALRSFVLLSSGSKHEGGDRFTRG